MSLHAADFEFIRTFIRDTAAIVIEQDRGYLVESRLGPVAGREGYGTIANLVEALRASSDLTRLHMVVIDALTTNETLFFRDLHPFETLKTEILPAMVRRAEGRTLHIWSAACSTGQEPYSVAMLLREHFPFLQPTAVRIRATDLAPRVLEQARAGSYSQLEVNRGISAPLLIRYFRQKETRWVIRDDVRAMVDFEQMNLVGRWPVLPVFDLILLRNVLIYFDREVRMRILANLVRHLHPQGYLVMGSAETPLGLCEALTPVSFGRSVFYQRAS